MERWMNTADVSTFDKHFVTLRFDSRSSDGKTYNGSVIQIGCVCVSVTPRGAYSIHWDVWRVRACLSSNSIACVRNCVRRNEFGCMQKCGYSHANGTTSNRSARISYDCSHQWNSTAFNARKNLHCELEKKEVDCKHAPVPSKREC